MANTGKSASKNDGGKDKGTQTGKRKTELINRITRNRRNKRKKTRKKETADNKSKQKERKTEQTSARQTHRQK